MVNAPPVSASATNALDAVILLATDRLPMPARFARTIDVVASAMTLIQMTDFRSRALILTLGIRRLVADAADSVDYHRVD